MEKEIKWKLNKLNRALFPDQGDLVCFTLQQQKLKDFSYFCLVGVVYSPELRISSCSQTTWAVIYRVKYNIVWAELKLTTTGDVAIPTC